MRALVLLSGRRCNLSCSYCYARHDHGRQKDKIVTDFTAMDAAMAAHGYGDWPATGVEYWGGEPLFNANFRRVVKHFRDKGAGWQSFVTNGTLIDDDTADWLIENRVSVNVSNDLAYHERTRGWQFLEDESRIEPLRRLCKAKLLRSFQTVISSDSPNLMRQYEYLKAWCERMGLEKAECPSLTAFPVKSYSPMEDYLMFTRGSEATRDMQEGMYQLTLECLAHGADGREMPILGNFFRNRLQETYDTLLGTRHKSTKCEAFIHGGWDLEGRKWSCPHDFERDPEHPKVFPPEPPKDEICDNCIISCMCNKICSGAEVWPEAKGLRRKNCESLRLYYYPMLQAIWDVSDEERRQTYVIRPTDNGEWVER